MNSPFRPRRFLPGILGADTVMPIDAPRAALANPGNGPIAGYTHAFDFYLTNFDWVTWHDYEWSNWIQVDALLNTAVGFLNIRGIWRPLTAYEAGDGVYDPEDIAKFYRALDDHTSGTDFVTDVAAGHWELVGELGPPVTTVFGRIGDVVATAGDYDAFYYTKAQVDASQAAQNAQIAGLQTGLGNVYTKSEAETRYVNVAGDTLTGLLTLSGNPTANLHAAPKQYVDAGDAAANANANTRVLKSGDTMTGMLLLPGTTPSNVNHATRKGYVDTQVATRAISAYGPPQPTTPSVGDLWFDTTPATYGTKMWNGTAWVDVAPGPVGGYVSRGGDTMTGTLTMSAGTPMIRFLETDAVSPAGQFALQGYGTGSFALVRYDGANWTTSVNIWRYIGSSGSFYIEAPLYLASGCDLTLNGGNIYSSGTITGINQIISRASTLASNNAYFYMQNPDGTERGALYGASNNGEVVLRNRAGTGTTKSYLQLNPDSTMLLGATAGIDTTGGVRINGNYIGTACLLLDAGYPSIQFYDNNMGSGYNRLAISGGNGWMRFATADATGALVTDLFSINPTNNAVRSYLPFFVVDSAFTLESSGPDIRFHESGQPAGKGFYRFIADAANFYLQSATEAAWTNRTSIFRYSDSTGALDVYVPIVGVQATFNNIRVGAGPVDNYIGNTTNAYIGFYTNAVTVNANVSYYFRDKDAATTVAAIYGLGTASPSGSCVITREKGDLRYTAASSRRYKTSIADADDAELVAAFDKLVLKSWIWGGEVPEADERYGTRGVGVIAEELATIFEPAVRSRWVQPPALPLNEDGTEPPEQPATEKIPDATDPNALIAMLVAKMRQLESELASLKEQRA